MNKLYRVGNKQKIRIAENLIEIVEQDADMLKETRIFIQKWVTETKRNQSVLNVWDYVLNNYLPTKYPILYRSCNKVIDNRISSFTGSWRCIEKMSKHKGLIIIYSPRKDDLLVMGSKHKKGKYINTYFPLVDVLIKINKRYGSYKNYIGEDEYIMREHSTKMNILKFRKEKD